MSQTKIIVEGLPIAMERLNEADYISLTDIAKYGNEQNDRANPPANTISNWLRNAQTLRYLQAWEQVHNPNFKLTQMSEFRLEATNHRTSVSPKRYIEETGAIGLITKAGNSGGTWAHSDIALEFCTWVSPEFKVWFFREFQRLKREEYDRRSLEWHVERVTDLLDEARNWMDTMPGQKPGRNRLKAPQ